MSSKRPGAAVVPIDAETPFAPHELFFSTTDEKGIIRSGNDVFVRVSGYEREQLVGRAHNVVRHPDMPRGVFQIFWDMLGEGTGVAAYVKNLAADGRYYWVMALVVPIDTGYLSVRLKPCSPLFDAARKIYAEVLEHEQAVEDGDVANRKAAIAAGVEKTKELLAAAGFSDYRTFMRAALITELSDQQEAFAASTHSAAGGSADPRAERALGTLSGASVHLDRLVCDLRQYASLAEEMTERSQFLLGLAGNIRLFSLNAVLTSARLGSQAAALGTVAQVLGRQSKEAEPEIRALNKLLEESVDALGIMQFRIAASKLLTEMVFSYLEKEGSDVSSNAAELADLANALSDGTDRLAEAMDRFYGGLAEIEGGAKHIDRLLSVVRALEINGRVEGARLGDAQIGALFTEVGKEVAEATDQLRGFGTLRAVVGEGAAEDGEGLCSALTETADDLIDLARG
jgi:aerotaxis receptor